VSIDYRQRIVQSKQLLRLQRMRVNTCETRYREAQQKRSQAQAEVDERQEAIDKLKEQRHQLLNYMSAAADSPRLMKVADTRRYWIEYDLERDEYYLQMDEDALADATQECANARKEWLMARSKEASAQSLLDASKHAVSMQAEQQQELESEDLTIGRVIS